MNAASRQQEILQTSVGDFPLDEYRLKTPERELAILHVAAVLTHYDESHFLLELKNPLPYGIALWSATVALAHDIVFRREEMPGKTVLELGAGTGLPGIAAAALGAKVVQTDRNELAMTLCKRNCARNGIETIEHRIADWTDWNETEKFDWIIGSDILYGAETRTHLRRIFDTNLVQGGRVLLSDPFRTKSVRLMEEMEKDGWKIAITKWSVGEESAPRPIGIFELSPPR
jgi:predicted nicotinamide N-methyase